MDLEATATYSRQELAENCRCAYCRNFYEAIDRYYPQLRTFLTQFGLELNAPDRMSPIDYDPGRTDYDPRYVVFGQILQMGTYELSVGLANICPSAIEDLIDGKPAFLLDVYEVSLPWILDESFPGGIPQKKTRDSWLTRLLNS